MIRDCSSVMHPNTRMTLVSGRCYKFHTALSQFGPHSELRSESISRSCASWECTRSQ